MTIASLEKQLEKLTRNVEETILERQTYWDNKSERWQESDKGVAYMEDTEMLSDSIDILEDAATYINSKNKS